jgi:FtsH-binding integral membrane protein
MSMFPNARRVELEYGTEARSIMSFFNAVYAWMAVGLGVTAVTAWVVAHTPALLNIIYAGPGMMLVMALAAFGIAWYVQAQFQRINPGVATALFILYAVVIGAMISYVFLIYKIETLGAAFIMTAGVFGGMSLYGFVTKRDLTGIGSILIMCVLGLFIASLVNLFLASNALSWIITYAVLAVFIGITAYETQRLKTLAYQFQGNGAMLSRLSIVGSLVLYISFINLFLSILRIMNSRR